VKKLLRTGEPFIWLTGGALALALIMVGGLVGVIMSNAAGLFWPASIVRVTLADGTVMTGQIADRERVPEAASDHRIKLRVANRDLYGADFVWIDEKKITRRDAPPEPVVIERTEWGLLIGTLVHVRDGAAVASGPAALARTSARSTRNRRRFGSRFAASR
jgi:phosphate transport system permease protein